MSLGWNGHEFDALDDAGKSRYMDDWEDRFAANQKAENEFRTSLGDLVMSDEFGQDPENINGLIGRINVLAGDVKTSGVARLHDPNRFARKRIVVDENRPPRPFSALTLKTFHPLTPGKPKITLGASVRASVGDHLSAPYAAFSMLFTDEQVTIKGISYWGMRFPAIEDARAVGAMNLISWLEADKQV